jgi:hypothetical protein
MVYFNHTALTQTIYVPSHILFIHLFSFKTPSLRVWAVMSGEGVAYCASSMRNGVKCLCKAFAWDTDVFIMYS